MNDDFLQRTFNNTPELSDENSSSDEESFTDTEFGLLGQTGEEHSYSSISSAICLVSMIKRALSHRYKTVLIANAPNEVREAAYRGHVCSLKMGVCSCISFINMGQPKFCKHLFACLALEQRLQNEKKIFIAFVNHVPELPHYIPKPKLYSEIQNNSKSVNWSLMNNIIQTSHLPSKEEERALRMGVLVSDTPQLNVDARSESRIGRPKARVAHRGGFRKQLNDKFLPNIGMPRDSRKRKVDSQQGSSQRRQVKKRKDDSASMYNEQLQNLATSKIKSAIAQTNVSLNSPDIDNHEKPKQNTSMTTGAGQYTPNCPAKEPSAFHNSYHSLSSNQLTQHFQLSPIPLQMAPLVQYQQVNMRQVWLNINGVLQPAYIV